MELYLFFLIGAFALIGLLAFATRLMAELFLGNDPTDPSLYW